MFRDLSTSLEMTVVPRLEMTVVNRDDSNVEMILVNRDDGYGTEGLD